MTRRNMRLHLFKTLYFYEFHKSEEFEKQIDAYLDEEGLNDEHHAEVKSKSLGVASHLDDIDRLINETAIGWKTSRMNKVDLSILRVAIYEMLYDDDVPESVAINEAIEIAKIFASDESPAFINGILGKISKKESEA